MTDLDVLVPAAIMAIIRRDETVRGVAERFGATEAEVEKWKDMFLIAGTLALRDFRGPRTQPYLSAAPPTHADLDMFLTTHSPGPTTDEPR